MGKGVEEYKTYTYLASCVHPKYARLNEEILKCLLTMR